METVLSQGLAGSVDEDIVAVCQREQRGFVTLDRDFSNPLKFKPAGNAGIAVLRLPAKPSHGDLIIVCRTLLRALEQDAFAGKLWAVERGRIREYRPDREDTTGLEI